MVLVLGATGMFGSRVLRETAARGAPVRALVHSGARAREVEGSGVEVAIGDLDDPESVAGAFDGVDSVFVVSPMDDRIEIRERNALRAAERAGVSRVVKLYGAVRHDGDPLDVLHRASIDAIKASGLSWALVSPNSVMETSLLSQADGLKQTGALFGSAGDGRIGLVAADDVARAAAVVLTERDESGVNYELTGPSALTMTEVAATMSDVLGRPVSYVDMPEGDFRSLLVEQAGVPEEVVDIQVMLHFAAWKRGDADLVTDTYEELTGRAPTSLAEWVAINREAFEAPASEAGATASSTA
jgi:NAD(P)H dehydrogenase (quinone)